MATPNVSEFCQKRIIEPVVQRYKEGRYVPLASELRAIKLSGAGSGIYGLGAFLRVHDKAVVRGNFARYLESRPRTSLAWRQILDLERAIAENGYKKSYTQIWCPQTTMNFGRSVVAYAVPRALPLPLAVLALNEARKWMAAEPRK